MNTGTPPERGYPAFLPGTKKEGVLQHGTKKRQYLPKEGYRGIFVDPLYPVGANEAHQKNRRKKMAGGPAAGLQMISPGVTRRLFCRENSLIVRFY